MNRFIPSTAVAASMVAVALFATPAGAQASGPFANCTAAYAAGRANIPAGDPAYALHLDGTKSAATPNEPDGIACENPPPGFKPATSAPMTTKAPPTTMKGAPATTKPPAVSATPRFTG